MTKILDRILNNLKIEDYIQVDHVTGFCEKYDPVSLRGHILDVVEKELLEEK